MSAFGLQSRSSHPGLTTESDTTILLLPYSVPVSRLPCPELVAPPIRRAHPTTVSCRVQLRLFPRLMPALLVARESLSINEWPFRTPTTVRETRAQRGGESAARTRTNGRHNLGQKQATRSRCTNAAHHAFSRPMAASIPNIPQSRLPNTRPQQAQTSSHEPKPTTEFPSRLLVPTPDVRPMYEYICILPAALRPIS